MSHAEEPASRIRRIAWLVDLWVSVAGPKVVLFFLRGGWFGLIPLAVAEWATYDYSKSGGFLDQIDSFDRFGVA